MKRLFRKILKLPEKLPVSPPAKKAAAPAHEVALRHAESLRLKTAKLNPDMSAKKAEVRRPRPKRQASAAPEPVDAGPKKTRKTLLRERRRADAADSPLGAEPKAVRPGVASKRLKKELLHKF